MAYLEAQEFFHRPLPKKKKRLKHFTTHSELFRPAHRDRSTAMIQCSPGGSLSNGNVGEDDLVFRTYAQWYTTEIYEPPKRNVRVPSAHARACVFETHGCCHELAWKCLRRCIRAQVCRLDITKGALWRTQWWCRGADFNRIMSTDRRDSTELFRVNAPPTPERKLLMETGQLPLAHAPLDWTLCFLYGCHFRFFLFLSFFSNSYDSPLVFLSLSFLRLRRISRDYKS